MEQYVYTIFTKKQKINRFINHAKHGCHEKILYMILILKHLHYNLMKQLKLK